jgi:hypothetical protein
MRYLRKKPCPRFPFPNRRAFRQCVKREFIPFGFLLLYIWSLFGDLLPHPAIHLLLPTFMQIVILLVLEHQGIYLLSIWRKRPTEPPLTFPWRCLANDLLVCLGPIVLIALLLLLAGYSW